MLDFLKRRHGGSESGNGNGHDGNGVSSGNGHGHIGDGVNSGNGSGGQEAAVHASHNGHNGNGGQGGGTGNGHSTLQAPRRMTNRARKKGLLLVHACELAEAGYSTAAILTGRAELERVLRRESQCHRESDAVTSLELSLLHKLRLLGLIDEHSVRSAMRHLHVCRAAFRGQAVSTEAADRFLCYVQSVTRRFDEQQPLTRTQLQEMQL